MISYHQAVVEIMAHAADLLISFMSFSTDQNRVIFLRHIQRMADGLSAVGDPFIGASGLPDAGFYFINDFIRILVPWVIGGQDAVIGQFAANPAHNGPLDGIPVSSAAKDTDEPPMSSRPDRLQHIFQAGGAVGLSLIHI